MAKGQKRGDRFSSFPDDFSGVIEKKELIRALYNMLLIRNFEIRGEGAYQAGKVGGFFHSYIGQEAIQTSCVAALGRDHYWITTYRCHALALLLGVSAEELMAELYGKESGNAKGRGGSMHIYAENMLGGFGIVAEQIPVAIGAAFQIKYRDIRDKLAICFLGDGAVAQGAFHEALNMASLWDLPVLFVIENNQWGMGTNVRNAIAVKRLAEDVAPSYNMKGYTLDGMDYFNCYNGFKRFGYEVLKKRRPVIVEAVTERFRGHSISDPGLYRSREELEKIKSRDPLLLFKWALIEEKIINEEDYRGMEKEVVELIKRAMAFAEKSPWPDPAGLEEDVFAP